MLCNLGLFDEHLGRGDDGDEDGDEWSDARLQANSPDSCGKGEGGNDALL